VKKGNSTVGYTKVRKLCVQCGERGVNKVKEGIDPVCTYCLQAEKSKPKVPCVLCGTRLVHTGAKLNKAFNEQICAQCRKTNPSAFKKCIRCSEVRAVEKLKGHDPICRSCVALEVYYDPSLHKHCSVCQRLAHVAGHDEKGQPLCPQHYSKLRPEELCTVCKEMAKVAKRDSIGGAICHACNKKAQKKQECFACGSVKMVSKNNKTKQLTCLSCRNRENPKPKIRYVCEVCSGEVSKCFKDAAGKNACSRCFQANPSNHESCRDCGEVQPVHSWNSSGEAICPKCHQKNRQPQSIIFIGRCPECNRKDVEHGKTLPDGSSICRNCWRRNPLSHKICNGCGELKRIDLTTPEGEKFCQACRIKRPSSHHECSGCHEVTWVAKRLKDKSPLCQKCYDQQRQKERCFICSKDKLPVARNKEGQSICSACALSARSKVRANSVALHKQCVRCEEVKYPAIHTDQEKPMCSACYQELRNKGISPKLYIPMVAKLA